MKKAIHFGAGNIGRGFIGLLLSQSNYQVTFVDVNKEIIDKINEMGYYTVQVVGKEAKEVTVQNVRGLESSQSNLVIDSLLEADIITTAVGLNVLSKIAPLLGNALETRRMKHIETKINVLACENAINNSGILKEEVYKTLSEEGRKYADQYVGFPNTTVDRIVPEVKSEGKSDNLLSVVVEEFYEWNVEREKFVGDIPHIQGMTIVDDLESYIERKLFTLNTGHAITAYLGYQSSYTYIHEAILDEHIREIVQGALMESGDALIKKHQFSKEVHKAYIKKIIMRFENKALNDPVERVGRDPIRKLGKNDRLIAPAILALQYGITPSNIIKGIAAALKFDYSQDNKAVFLQEKIKNEGLKSVLMEISKLDIDEMLIHLILNEMQKK